MLHACTTVRQVNATMLQCTTPAWGTEHAAGLTHFTVECLEEYDLPLSNTMDTYFSDFTFYEVSTECYDCILQVT
jgi:uncharacterized protein YceK